MKTLFVMLHLSCCVVTLRGKGETMLSHDLIVAPSEARPRLSSRAARRATASSTSCAPRSTTATQGKPTAGRSARSSPSWSTAAGRADKTSAPRRPGLPGSRQGQRPVDRHPQTAHGRHPDALQRPSRLGLCLSFLLITGAEVDALRTPTPTEDLVSLCAWLRHRHKVSYSKNFLFSLSYLPRDSRR